EAHLWYGVANLWVHDLPLAEKHLKEAAELDPKEGLVHYYLHNYYFAKGDFAAARGEFLLLDELSPDDEIFEEVAMTQKLFAPATADSAEGKLLIEIIENCKKNGLRALSASLHPDLRKKIRDAIGSDELGDPHFVRGF